MGLGFRGIAMPLIAFALAALPTAQADPSESANGPDALGTAVGTACSPVGLSGTPPQPVVNLDCLFVPWALPGSTCAAVVVAGTPPQVGVNWDCLGILDGSPGDPMRMCDTLGLSGTPPQPVVNWDCLWWTVDEILGGTGPAATCAPDAPDDGIALGGGCPPIVAGNPADGLFPGRFCSFLVLSGIPPQPVVNWDCLTPAAPPPVLFVRG